MQNIARPCILMLVAGLVVGCGSVDSSSLDRRRSRLPDGTTVSHEFTEDRQEKMQARIDQLKDEGYSEERALGIASREVPLMQTVYTAPLRNAFKGEPAPDTFNEDFARSLKQE